MEEKADLMLKSQKLGLRLEQIQTKIAELEAELQDIPTKCRLEEASAVSQAKKIFEESKSKKLKAIAEIVSKKKQQISKMIDAMPESDTCSVVTRDMIHGVESSLGRIYPPTLIEDYACLNPKSYRNDDEVSAQFAKISSAIEIIQQSSLAGKIFTSLSALLDKAADQQYLGMRVAGGMCIFLVGGLVLSPFLFLTVFTVLGISCGVYGIYVQGLLRDLYSIKLYVANDYDEEKFLQDKSDIMDIVCPYLEEAGDEATAEVEKEEYRVDPDLVPSIQKKYDTDAQRIQHSLDTYRVELGTVQKELEGMIQQLELLAEKEKAAADVARDKYLHTITWKPEWLDGIFLDVTPENKVRMMHMTKMNTLFYSQDIESLKVLSRLIVWQSALHMHPDYASTVVLDYKYNGGELVQFSGVSDRCIKLAYSDDDISTQLASINNRIRSRTNNILSTCSSIEEYNELMSGYGTSGEYYVIVHIFGLESIPSSLLSNIRNGNRVGYFFKFYWTAEEMQALKDTLPLDDIKEFYEITDIPIPRTKGAIHRLLGISA